jgi:hypothetical protein
MRAIDNWIRDAAAEAGKRRAVVSKPWVSLHLFLLVFLGLGGLIWPPYVVLAHLLDGNPWWLVFLATVVVGAIGAWVGRGMRRAFGDGSLGGGILNAVGIALSGTLLGALIAFVVAPFTGRPGLMPSALSLGMSCMAVSAAVGYGISRVYLTWGQASLTLGVPFTPEQAEEGWKDWGLGAGRRPEDFD